MTEINAEKKLELLEKIPFFTDFALEDLQTIADLCYAEKKAKGETVIEQDKISMTLYFLINGTLSVFVNEEFVISFRGGGQVFGEMSFVGHDVASATITAKSDVTLLCLDVADISKLKDPIYYRLRMCLYRACGETLSKRLKATNENAKFFNHHTETD